MLVFHVCFQTLRRLTGVSDRPHALVEFAGHVFDQRLVSVHLDVPEHAVGKSEFLGELVHDYVVRQRVEGRLDNLFTPLQRPVGRSYGTVGFVLCRSRQKINTVRTV